MSTSILSSSGAAMFDTIIGGGGRFAVPWIGGGEEKAAQVLAEECGGTTVE